MLVLHMVSVDQIKVLFKIYREFGVAVHKTMKWKSENDIEIITEIKECYFIFRGKNWHDTDILFISCKTENLSNKVRKNYS